MQTLSRAAALVVMMAALSAIHSFSQTTDPIVGTWVLNVAKSKYSPGPGPKSETRTYVVAGADIKATSKGVGSDGKPVTTEWTINYDGKDHAVTGDPDIDALSFKHIDAYTTEFTQKRGGKVISTGTRTFSKDGKVMTITTKGTNANGQTINNVEVFDKR